MNDCLFCKIIKKEIPCEKLYEDENIFIFLDINPVNPGHCLVIPKKHFVNILDTPEEVLSHMIKGVKKIAPIILRTVNATDFCLGSNNGKFAGQVIYHIHFHVIPRFENDNHVHWKNKTIDSDELKKIKNKIKNYV